MNLKVDFKIESKSTLESTNRIFSNLKSQGEQASSAHFYKNPFEKSKEYQLKNNFFKNKIANNFLPVSHSKLDHQSAKLSSGSLHNGSKREVETRSYMSSTPALTMNKKEIIINDFLGNKKRVNVYNPYNLQVSRENNSIYSYSFSKELFEVTGRFESKQLLVFD